MLNGGRDVIAPETAARIDAAIADLGYRPNRFAQALRTQRSMVIACIVPDLTNPFYPALVAGVQAVAGPAEYDVVAISTGGQRAAELAAISGAHQGRYDGIVGVFFALRTDDFRPLIQAGVALVRIEAAVRHGGHLAMDDLFVDNVAASRQAAEYLIGLGHRQIAMIAGQGGPQGKRVAGYQAALQARGLAPSIWLDPSFTDQGGRAATRRMLAAGQRPTAILAANDLMAFGAMQELTAGGISVPGDVSVLGFDDIDAARLTTPQLSSVALFQDRLGSCAAERLLDRIAGRASGPGIATEMPFELRRRASTGAPKP